MTLATGRGELKLFGREIVKGREGIEKLKLSGHGLITSASE